MKMNCDLTADDVRSRYDYDPETGVFTSKIYKRAVGWSYPKGYIGIQIGKKTYAAHRLAYLVIFGSWPEGMIDHINRITNDNRIANLRASSNAENQQNIHAARKDSSLGLLGVRKHNNRFVASIRKNKKRIHIGLYKTAEEAHAAYLKAKAELHPFSTITKPQIEQEAH